VDEQTTGQQQSVGDGQTVGRTQGSGLDEGGGLGQAPTRPTKTPDLPAPSGSHAYQADQAVGEDGGDATGPTGPAGVDPDRDRRQDPRVADESGHPAQDETPAERNLSGDNDNGDNGDSDNNGNDTDGGADGQRDPEEDRKAAEEFAAEHDPEKHDTAAGEEFRQRGDWTAEDTGGPQVWDAEGTLVEGSGPGSDQVDASSSGPAERGDGGQDDHNDDRDHDDHGHDDRQQGSGERRTSTVEEIRDGGYGVGSAAPLDDQAMPFGHPVKAWHDTQTFVDTDHPRYDDAEPHVWFTDAEAARSAGFRRAGD
jgi:hypothetical protein